jgi:branched-chain amino acid transport system substrate-binding protein
MYQRKPKITAAMPLAFAALLLGGCGSGPTSTSSSTAVASPIASSAAASAKPATSAPSTAGSAQSNAAQVSAKPAGSASPSAAAAAPSSASPAASGNPVKIGVLLPFTGASASVSQEQFQGALTYFEQEARSAIGGRPLQVVREDTGGDTNAALIKMQKLVENDKVAAVIGPSQSNEGLAVRDYVIRQGIPQLFPIPGDLDEMGVPNRAANIFRTDWVQDISEAIKPAPVIDLGYKRIAWLAYDYAAGQKGTDVFIPAYEKLGGKVVYKTMVPLTIVDVAPIISQIDPKQVDAIVMWLFGPAAIRVMQQAQTTLPGLPVLDVNPILAEGKAAGDAAVGVMSFSVYTPTLDNPANKVFVQNYTQKYRDNPTTWSVDGYLAARAIGEAAAALQGKVEERQGLAAAIQKVQFDSPRGPFRFDSNGVAPVTFFLGKFEKRGAQTEFVQVKTVGTIDSKGPVK